MNDLSFVKKLTSGKRKFIFIFVLLLIIAVVYFTVNTYEVNYSVAIDKEKSTDEFSNVNIKVSLIKLPFNYLICHGSIIIDNQVMIIGDNNAGSKYQIIKDTRKHDIYVNYYNPKYYTEDYTEKSIDGGLIFLVKSEKDFEYLYTDILIYRTKLSTTITESFMVSGKLIINN